MAIQLIGQEKRPKCSIPLLDADLSLDNANWTKGLQSMSDWIWSGNLNPVPFPNNLGRFFLQVPGIFEQQLNYSTTLIFDEPSYRNGIQVSGFLGRVQKEMIISFIGQKRRAWYTMTHHAILGYLTALKHGLTRKEFSNKWSNLLNYKVAQEHYTDLEMKLLDFASCFAENPKQYTDGQMTQLKAALKKYNAKNYMKIDYEFLKINAAKLAKTKALSGKIKINSEKYREILSEYISQIPSQITNELNEKKVNAQIIELSFLCLQFIGLSCVFTGLNIPDEGFLSSVLNDLVPEELIATINNLNEEVLNGSTPNFLPPTIGNQKEIGVDSDLMALIIKGNVTVKPAPLKGSRIPLTPYEGKDEKGNFKPAYLGVPDEDKGLTIGGIQVGVYGWGFGGHFPGSLVYALMNHPELARFEAPYSLPLLFNEDEWRNGIQTAGFISRKLKEFVIHKIYKLNRSRYGIEHHTMFLYNAIFDEYGVGRISNPNFTTIEKAKAKKTALNHAETIVLFMHDHTQAPLGAFSKLEEELLTWVEKLLKVPHQAYKQEKRVRLLLKEQNELEIEIGIRILDKEPKIGSEAALDRLIDHQISEIAMLIGHMDGLGRLLTILKLEGETAVQTVKGNYTNTGGIKPELDSKGQVIFTGFFNNRPALLDILNFIGVSDKAQTINELFLNPTLCKRILKEIKKNPNSVINIESISNGKAEF